MKNKKIWKDVLVIGGGIGGMIAAIEATKLGVDVLLVSKGLIGKSGASIRAEYCIYGMPFLSANEEKAILEKLVREDN